MNFNFHNHFVKSVFIQYVRVSCCCPGICVRAVVRSSSRSQQRTPPSLPLLLLLFLCPCSLAVTLARVGVWGPAGAEHRDQLNDCLFVTKLLFFFLFLLPRMDGMCCCGPLRWLLYDGLLTFSPALRHYINISNEQECYECCNTHMMKLHF